MSTSIVGNRRSWSLARDEAGYREYTLLTLVWATSTSDGPQIVMNTPGLPLVGSMWTFGNDLDMWAWCLPTMRVTIHQEKQGDPNVYWKVEQKFSNKPHDRCQDTTIEDPLLEPQKISGTFVKHQEETGYGYASLALAAAGGDRTQALTTYSHEPLRGIQIDKNRPTVRIEQNVASLGLATFSEMVDTLNDDALWGLAKRKIKLSNVSWERKFYGQCFPYYTRIFDFDVDFETFDRKEPSFGQMALGELDANGTWVTAGYDPDTLSHFHRFKDSSGEAARTFHDEDGKPVVADDAAEVDIIYYKESNLLLLGIPTILG